ncbi:hypothetical protein LWI28_020034 [Acer negundo]|uniref:Uncharacterized protein n=1 Tax=Acer negundo TaxID=4023 RepID=A0AAD5IJE3_ACENE|nr:hypothetical protein LWI28_020034 [Acer negundo]
MKNVNPKPAHGYMGKISVLPLYEGMGIEYPTNIEECENFTKLMWPQENDRFCEIAHTYSNIVAELQQLVMRLLFESYGIEKHYENHKESTTYLLRLLKYSKSQTDRTNVALKVHTDKSLVSILHSNHVKGLELRTKDGEWLQFEPSPTSFVVIAGDAVMGGEARFHECMRDSRDKFVSVFVDNLNLVVDLVGLWGIFKTFERVRNVFFSGKKNSRCSYYSFIRFETLEEARKVAPIVNGMHVYEWPIIAKVADFGWDK